ncbi:GGDEF domain-containing protein [Devosia sp.]|uniref:GGDEF domain-containing protein n=1 Tax=Devosia sp. TaxID=1871048 RepID=UPI0037BFAE14
MARALGASTREIDIVGRMGGDEFIVVVRDEDLAGARLIAERIRRAVVDCDLAKLLGKDVLGNVTASIGIAQYQKGNTIAELYERADRCLFQAKAKGRNQVVAETPIKRDNAA